MGGLGTKGVDQSPHGPNRKDGVRWSGGVEKREMSGLERCSAAVEAAA